MQVLCNTRNKLRRRRPPYPTLSPVFPYLLEKNKISAGQKLRGSGGAGDALGQKNIYLPEKNIFLGLKRSRSLAKKLPTSSRKIKSLPDVFATPAASFLTLA